MKILIIKLSSLGDLFHALPAVHAIKKDMNAEIDWVVNDVYAGLTQKFEDVSEIIPFPRNNLMKNLPAFLRNLRKKNYDLVIDMQGLLKSALIAKAAKAKKILGPSFQREGAFLFYDEICGKKNKNRHAVEEILDIAKHLGTNTKEITFPLKYETPILNEPSPRIGVAALSRWATKNWPAECFIDTANKLYELKGASIYLIGGKESADFHRTIIGKLKGPVVDMAGKLELADMPGFMKAIDLLISNDSGPVHVAAAVGTPVVVIFGPTDPIRTGPYGKNNRIIKASTSCSPCFSRTCRRGNVECLKGITPEKVVEAAIELLGSKL